MANGRIELCRNGPKIDAFNQAATLMTLYETHAMGVARRWSGDATAQILIPIN